MGLVSSFKAAAPPFLDSQVVQQPFRVTVEAHEASFTECSRDGIDVSIASSKPPTRAWLQGDAAEMDRLTDGIDGIGRHHQTSGYLSVCCVKAIWVPVPTWEPGAYSTYFFRLMFSIFTKEPE